MTPNQTAQPNQPAHIETVRGPIDAAQLGVTQTHEHLWCNQALCRTGERWRPASPRALMILDELDVAIDELREVKALGGGAIVEATVGGWGRDVGKLRELSEATGLHVIACGGYYIEACHPLWARDLGIDELADVLVKEATEGADGTDIKIGILKSAISRPVIEGEEERCARAVARAQVRTGLTITTHTSGNIRFEIEGGNIGMQHLDLFEAEGVDPSRVIVGHTDENPDLRFLEALCRRGAYVQFDVIGKGHWMLDETRADLAARLIDRGFGRQLLLGSDRARKTELLKYGGQGYRHLLLTFVPMLRAAGLDDAAVRMLLVENPARALQVRGAVPIG